MRPLRDLALDERFVIARCKEEFPYLLAIPGYYNGENPRGILFCTEKTKVLQVYQAPSVKEKNRRLLVIEKFCKDPSKKNIFEILTQLEKEYILELNYRPRTQAQEYSLFRICYK